MACKICNRTDALKTYTLRNGLQGKTEEYCANCYNRLFLDEKKADEETSFSACPYCGTTVAELQKTKMTGCGYCYRMLYDSVLPVIVKMQGKKAHNGKTPPSSFYNNQATEENKQNQTAKARFERQCYELNIIIRKLQRLGRYEEARGYADKLSIMKSKATIEEEFVWH